MSHAPLSFQPDRQHIETMSIEVYNEMVDEIEALKSELQRCRQKVAHLLKEKENK